MTKTTPHRALHSALVSLPRTYKVSLSLYSFRTIYHWEWKFHMYTQIFPLIFTFFLSSFQTFFSFYFIFLFILFRQPSIACVCVHIDIAGIYTHKIKYKKRPKKDIRNRMDVCPHIHTHHPVYMPACLCVEKKVWSFGSAVASCWTIYAHIHGRRIYDNVLTKEGANRG